MRKYGYKYIAALAIALLLVGYGLGKQVGAGGFLPGSKEDPLVSKSYVDHQITSEVKDLQQQVVKLNDQIQRLEKQLGGSIGPDPRPPVKGDIIKLTIGSRTAYIGGRAQEIEVPPILSNGYTMLPLRFVGETLGASFDFESKTKTVTFKTASRTVKLRIGERTAQVDGKDVRLDKPAEITSGRTLVPLRFVGESLGAGVDWDNAKKMVTITP
ncbi:MAG: hypothetical protein GX318_01725 [Clostridia bacterium]|nr:hypothetical protein [Clostridia bacterium]